MHSLSSTPAYHIYASPERFRSGPAVTDTADTCCEAGVSESAAVADDDNTNDADAVDCCEDAEDTVSCMMHAVLHRLLPFARAAFCSNCQNLLCVQAL